MANIPRHFAVLLEDWFLAGEKHPPVMDIPVIEQSVSQTLCRPLLPGGSASREPVNDQRALRNDVFGEKARQTSGLVHTRNGLDFLATQT